MTTRPFGFYAAGSIVLCLALLLAAAGTSHAAVPLPSAVSGAAGEGGEITVPENLTAEEREELLARLSDEQVRGLILKVWEQSQPAAAGAEDRGAVGGLLANADLFRSNFNASLASVPELPEVISLFFSSLIPDDGGADDLVWVALGLVLIFAVGLAAEWLYKRSTANAQARIEARASDPDVSRLAHLLGLYLLRNLGLVVFALATLGAFFLLHSGHDDIRFMVLFYLAATVVFRVLALTSDFLFAPHAPGRRVLAMGDGDAQAIHKRWVIAVGFLAYAITTNNLLERFGASDEVGGLIATFIGVLAAVLLIAAIWRTRLPLAQLIRGEEGGGAVRLALGNTWHFILGAAVLTSILVAEYAAFTGFANVTSAVTGTLLLLVAVPLMVTGCRQLLDEMYVARSHLGVEPGEAENVAGWDTSKRLIEHAVHVGIVIVSIVLVANLWGIDVLSMSQTGVGGKIFGAVIEILVALFLAYVIWELAKRSIDPYLPKEADQSAGPADEGGGTGATRISTLIPLLRKFLLITVVCVTVMVVLSALGVNIGPLLAGAGVVGIAIGFGAQTLVRDVLSGMFFLMDDAFRKGEYIDIGSVKGTVQRISVRSLQLRHHNGPVHTVPYGEVQYVTNYSRDWSIMKFELRIPFETDVDLVRRIIKKVGQQLMEDEEIAPMLLEPLKSQGVNRMDDSAFVVRCKFTSIPGQQFYVRRIAYTAIQRAFEEKGIKFAPRRVIVETTTPESSKGGDAEKAAAALAAAAAAGALDTEHVDDGAQADDRG